MQEIGETDKRIEEIKIEEKHRREECLTLNVANIRTEVDIHAQQQLQLI